MSVFVDQLLQVRLALDQRQLPQVVAVEIEQVEGDHHDLGGPALQLVLQHREIGGAVGGRHHDLAVDDRRARADVPGVVGDLLEAVGPVVAAAGEDLHGLVGEMDLDPVAVELDLVNPALAGRHLLDRCRQRGFDEAGKRRLDADRRWLLALERPWSDQAHGQRQLYVAVAAFVAVDEVLEEERNVAHLQIAAPAQLMGDICGDVLRPALGGVEGDDADRVVVLAGQQVLDHGFQVGGLDVGSRARRGRVCRNRPPPDRRSDRLPWARSRASNWTYASSNSTQQNRDSSEGAEFVPGRGT